jgi:hypothetical protein
METNKRPSPPGEYGVYCEAFGHPGNPCWIDKGPLTYDAAVEKADEMCRANHQWHYYAKPIGYYLQKDDK